MKKSNVILCKFITTKVSINLQTDKKIESKEFHLLNSDPIGACQSVGFVLDVKKALLNTCCCQVCEGLIFDLTYRRG